MTLRRPLVRAEAFESGGAEGLGTPEAICISREEVAACMLAQLQQRTLERSTPIRRVLLDGVENHGPVSLVELMSGTCQR